MFNSPIGRCWSALANLHQKADPRRPSPGHRVHAILSDTTEKRDLRHSVRRDPLGTIVLPILLWFFIPRLLLRTTWILQLQCWICESWTEHLSPSVATPAGVIGRWYQDNRPKNSCLDSVHKVQQDKDVELGIEIVVDSCPLLRN